MIVEVMGCPTVCQHCWAMGRDYQVMPLSDIAWILQEVRRYCVAHELAYDGYPMHEVAAHPQATHVLRLFHEIWQVDFQPLPTTGVPLATRSDWREILDTLREIGASTLWFAFHGAGAVHDRAVMRKGAYRKSLHAVELVREAGMRAGCNLFVTKENVWQFDQLVTDLQHAGIHEIIPQFYSFTPNARGRHTEPLRPEWRDVEPLVEKLDGIPETCKWRQFWRELPEMHTESWYVQQARAGTWPDIEGDPHARHDVSLVSRPNLDVYLGNAGQYTRRYGNLRRDGVDEVLSRAVAEGESSYDEIWFPGEQVLTIQELAANFGDAQSERIHIYPGSIRDWWMDCSRRARRAARV
jgi:hypothetical protein